MLTMACKGAGKLSTKAEKELVDNFNLYVMKITNLINDFHFNVVVAQVYEIHRLINEALKKPISNECFKNILIKFMKILIPFTPHLASECLQKIGERKIDEWPVVDKKSIQEVKIKVAIQINGKTKGVIEVKKDLPEKDLIKESQHDKKISKNLLNKEIIRIIYVKNRIINYLVK